MPPLTIDNFVGLQDLSWLDISETNISAQRRDKLSNLLSAVYIKSEHVRISIPFPFPFIQAGSRAGFHRPMDGSACT